LMATAARREVPIPVYAEMSSINPVLLFPGAMATRADALAVDYISSLTLGAGQFCTNPGLIIGCKGAHLEEFIRAAERVLSDCSAGQMLSPTIFDHYQRGVAELATQPGATLVARSKTGAASYEAQGALFRTTAAHLLSSDALRQEVFGASSVIVAADDVEQMKALLWALEGQLTITFHLDPDDEPIAADLIRIAERKAGRILANAWPTGVEVCHSMVHGGPYPATSDSRTTSVGARAIERFLRPVCYQGIPTELLPVAIGPENAWRLPERVNGLLAVERPAP